MLHSRSQYFRCVTSIEVDSVFGFLINRPSPLKLFGLNVTMNLLTSKHWYAVRKLNNDNFYNLDSKAREAVRIGGRGEFLEFVRSELEGKEKELFLVVSREVQEEASWRTSSP